MLSTIPVALITKLNTQAEENVTVSFMLRRTRV